MLPLILTALIAVESGGNALAVGDHGRARGILQIHENVVRDVNRFAGTRYTWDDAWDPAKSRAICTLYLEHYATPERLGHAPSAQDLARIWNGGPRGFVKPATIRYAERVARNL